MVSSKEQWFWAELDRYLIKQDLKQTTQRKTILKQFMKIGKHVDAEELHDSLRKDGYAIGLATIYRTLNLLTDAGLAEQNTFSEGKTTYEISSPNSHHDHLICLDCNHVYEFEDERIEAIQKEIAEKYSIKLSAHRLDLFGHCQKKSCSHRKK